MILDSKQTKQQILDEFLKICPFDGWNKDALSKAIVNCKIEEKFVNLIFENGLLDLIEFYIESQNEKAAQKIAATQDFHTKKIREKITLALHYRFEVELEHRVALQRLVNFYLNPKNFTSLENGSKPAIQGLKHCYKIADFIWREINDQSTDFNFYTKRLTLSKIIWRSLLIFVKDETQNFEKTKNFIDSEIQKVMKFEKCKIQLKKFVSETFQNQAGELKSPQELIKNLPFIRLIKFK